jgi:hypothetical protein
MNNQLTTQELKSKIMEFLKEHNEGALGTCLNNIPRSSPVQYYVGADMTIYIIQQVERNSRRYRIILMYACL